MDEEAKPLTMKERIALFEKQNQQNETKPMPPRPMPKKLQASSAVFATKKNSSSDEDTSAFNLASQSEVVTQPKKLVNMFQQNIDNANKTKDDTSMEKPVPKKLVNAFQPQQDTEVKKEVVQPAPQKLVSAFKPDQEPVIQKTVVQPPPAKLQPAALIQEEKKSEFVVIAEPKPKKLQASSAVFTTKKNSSSDEDTSAFNLASQSEVVTQPKKLVNMFQQNIDNANKAKDDISMVKPVPKKLVSAFKLDQEPVIQKTVVQPPPAKLQPVTLIQNDQAKEESKIQKTKTIDDDDNDQDDFKKRLEAMLNKGPPKPQVRRQTTAAEPLSRQITKKRMDVIDSDDDKAGGDDIQKKRISHIINPMDQLLTQQAQLSSQIIQMKPKTIAVKRKPAKKIKMEDFDDF